MTQVSRTRISRDESGERVTFEEIEIGASLGDLEWIVTPEDIDKQCILDDDRHDWFLTDSPFGGRIAPPQIQYRPPRWLLSRKYNLRGVLYKWEFENVKAIRPGEPIMVAGRIVDKWIKNNREFVKLEAVGRDHRGEIVFKTWRVHALDVIDRSAPREGVGIDSGIKAERI
jgi:hypothetical protein